MRTHISWTLGCRLVVFHIRFYIHYKESGILQRVVRVGFHSLNGMACLYDLDARVLLLYHSFRCLIADTISRPYILTADAFVFCFRISTFFLFAICPFLLTFLLSFETVS